MSVKKELIINPVLTEKEAELKSLQKKYQALLKKLETEKSKIQQLKEDMIAIQRQAFAVIQAKMLVLKQLQQELQKLLTDASTSRLLTKREKKILKQMAKDMDTESPAEQKETSEGENTWEEQEARSADFFSAFAVSPAPIEGQNIRKLFLKLATRFHPDKARNNKESEELHILMQRINEAYKNGDMAALLAIEAQYLTSEYAEVTDSVSLIDQLQKQIDRLMSDIELLDAQLRRTKKETANINRSEAGKMHKHMKKNDGMLQYMTHDMDQAIDGLTALRDGLQTFLKTGIMPASLARELQPEPHMEIDMDEVLAMVLEMQEQEDRRRQAKRKARKKNTTRNNR
ncbi:hypothetical protein GXP67_22785 [Rhodocytophaga rosea]|uniref:J domain-containing protein n=1 Tax=Rhodocytophaga rosea TaxID=2704465 RepID=A0A6C0GMK8_9BACT|nr:hypothetical protein [Rhodocytophaga rosea]QHT69259.1 hypothetical protein GXP67_22785 [Rhodocytophaga rosea]